MGAGLVGGFGGGRGAVSEFFAMGGHGVYVWLAYGISFAVLFALGLRPIVVRRRIVVDALREADAPRDDQGGDR